MRHVIHVVGSRNQAPETLPRINRGDGENLHETLWYACADQKERTNLLDDTPSFVLRCMRGVGFGYHFYQVVHATKLWSGKRPLILVQGRSFSSRVAAYVGTWAGGDVVMPVVEGIAPLGPTRFMLDADGNLVLYAD